MKFDDLDQKMRVFKTVADKNELLFTHGINFNDLPNWQKRGAGLYWVKTEKIGYNPKDNTETKAERYEIYTDLDLPMGDEYSNFIEWIIQKNFIANMVKSEE